MATKYGKTVGKYGKRGSAAGKLNWQEMRRWKHMAKWEQNMGKEGKNMGTVNLGRDEGVCVVCQRVLGRSHRLCPSLKQTSFLSTQNSKQETHKMHTFYMAANECYQFQGALQKAQWVAIFSVSSVSEMASLTCVHCILLNEYKPTLGWFSLKKIQ